MEFGAAAKRNEKYKKVEKNIQVSKTLGPGSFPEGPGRFPGRCPGRGLLGTG